MQIKVTTLAALFFTVLSSGCGGGGADAPQTPPTEAQKIDFEQGQIMPAGFQVIGGAGQVQVDGSFANLGLVAKGTVSIPASGSITTSTVSMPQITPQIVVTGSTPILCIAPKIVNAAIARVQQNGNTFSYTILGSASASGETFNWYLFDKMAISAAGTGGLQVFNGSGQIVFNSNASPMRIAAVGAIPNAAINTTPATVNASVSGTYAACISQGRINSSWNSQVTTVWIEGAKINANGATTAQVVGQYIPSQVSVSSSLGGQILLVDVSGL